METWQHPLRRVPSECLGSHFTQLPKSTEISVGAVGYRASKSLREKKDFFFCVNKNFGLLKLTFTPKFFNVWACIFKRLPQNLLLISRWYI